MMMSWADIGEDLLGLIDDRLGQRDVASHGLPVDRVAERDRLPDREVILDADLSGIPATRDRLIDPDKLRHRDLHEIRPDGLRDRNLALHRHRSIRAATGDRIGQIDRVEDGVRDRADVEFDGGAEPGAVNMDVGLQRLGVRAMPDGRRDRDPALQREPDVRVPGRHRLSHNGHPTAPQCSG
jgi:hypothetical protein